MFDTFLTVVGVVITNLDRHRVESTGNTVVNFRLASTSRRYDRSNNTWTDRETLFIRVACWRQLAENIFQSVYKGDPVMVTGRVYTRSYLAGDGTRRWTYEMDASAVGHDLARGVSSFVRNQRAGAPELAAAVTALAGTAEDPLSPEGDPGPLLPDAGPDDPDRLAVVAAGPPGVPATDDITTNEVTTSDTNAGDTNAGDVNAGDTSTGDTNTSDGTGGDGTDDSAAAGARPVPATAARSGNGAGRKSGSGSGKGRGSGGGSGGAAPVEERMVGAA
jgi:single-strand DNA-binding protein